MSVYTVEGLNGELRQAELITNLVQFTYDPTTDEAFETPHAFTIVMSYDCDLLLDYKAVNSGKPSILIGVLIFEAEPAGLAERKTNDRRIWKLRAENREDRYHYLTAVPANLDLSEQGLPSLVINFRRFFTMPASEIYRQCSSGQAQRRCRLESPYREHLQNRAGHYLQRVAIPDEIAISEAIADVQKAGQVPAAEPTVPMVERDDVVARIKKRFADFCGWLKLG